MELTAEQEHTKNGHKRQGNGGCANHRKGLGKNERVESFPSCPVSANTGTNARMIIAIEKNVGRPTSFVARKTVSKTRPRLLVSTPSRCLKAFSVTTIPASTSTPIAMAIPASDITFEVTWA